MFSHYAGKHRAKTDRRNQVATFLTVTVTTALIAGGGVAAAGSDHTVPQASSNTSASIEAVAFLYRDSLLSVSRTRDRDSLAPPNLGEISVPGAEQAQFDGPDKWQQHEDLRVARLAAVATATAARVQAAKVKAVKVKAAKAKAVKAKAVKAAALEAERAKIIADQAAADRAAAIARQAKAAWGDPQTTPGPSTALVSESKQWAATQLTAMGYGPEQFTCLDQLWTRESGWNPLADNPESDAYGIPQSLPGAKMASAGPDWRTNPSTQITWGLGYIKTVYGNPCRAWAHSEQTNWY
ncbi:aggregation-promoting factor C-terminal-like domain-containing protein [Tessaracoccus sp.]